MTRPTHQPVTREEWHCLVAQYHDAAVLSPGGTPLPPVRWSTGYPPGTRGRGVAHVLPPARSRDGMHWEVYISPTIGPGDRWRAALTCAVAAAIARQTSLPKPTDVTGWEHRVQRMMTEAADALDAAGPYPSSGLEETHLPVTQRTRMLKVQCSACTFLFRTTAKHIAAMQADAECPACARRHTLKTPANL